MMFNKIKSKPSPINTLNTKRQFIMNFKKN